MPCTMNFVYWLSKRNAWNPPYPILMIPLFQLLWNLEPKFDQMDWLTNWGCMRGDLQADLTDFDTWCPMAGYSELKLQCSRNVASTKLISLAHSCTPLQEIEPSQNYPKNGKNCSQTFQNGLMYPCYFSSLNMDLSMDPETGMIHWKKPFLILDLYDVIVQTQSICTKKTMISCC